MTHFYRAYGLILTSDTAVPGLRQETHSSQQSDLVLQLGPEPEWVRDALRLPSHLKHNEPATPETADPAFLFTSLGEGEFFQLAYTDGTRFVVDHAAARVWGTCPPPLTIEDLATYLLGPVMGFVLQRRGVTSLHASSVSIAGKAVILSGAAEAGKSTTAAALALRGVPVLCEDISPLKEENGQFEVQPGYPRVCLWPDAVEKLLGTPEALPRLTPNWEKCYLALDGVQAGFEPQKRPLGVVYLLAPRSTDQDAPRVEAMSAREAVLELVQNTYMNSLLDRAQRAAEFDVLTRLVSAVPVRRIVPHCNPERIGALCALLVADAERLCASKGTVASVPGH